MFRGIGFAPISNSSLGVRVNITQTSDITRTQTLVIMLFFIGKRNHSLMWKKPISW